MPAISSIRRPTTWDRRNWRWRRNSWRSASAPISTAWSARTSTRQNFPLIHAVGMASSRAPRLIDFTWGDPTHPKVTLVGKGVCFDTGGLDLKPSSGMLIMKKDMGGAANVLALAQMVMDARLKVRLRVLIPGGRERGRRQRFPSARYLPLAQGHHGGNRQYRRRRSAGAGRCAGARRRGETRSA